MTIFTGHSRRRVLGLGVAGLAAASLPARAQGRVVRIGVPTKTYYPTIIAETAIRQKLFEKEGIIAELTIYRGGAEGYEALAAGAADVIMNSASSVSAGIKKGVLAKNVAGIRNILVPCLLHPSLVGFAPAKGIRVTRARQADRISDVTSGLC